MVAILNTFLTSLTAVLALNSVGVSAKLASYGFVYLNLAGPYGALSASGITNTGASVITGKMGTTSTSITGFPPGVVTGSTDKNNAAATLAYSSFQNAYSFGKGLTPTVNKAGKTTLDGETLVAGVYRYDSGVGLTGAITFDGAGNTNSVWVMQIAETLVTGAASQMILSGGAKSSNIFWIVGSSATLGTTSVLQGSVLASASITANTGSTINGGLYAQSSIALQSTTVTPVKNGYLSFLGKRAVAFNA